MLVHVWSAAGIEIKVTLSPERRLVAASKDVGFECGHNLDSSSTVLIYWQKDGGELSSSKRIEQNSKGILILRNVQQSDSGVYTCAVRSVTERAQQGWAHAVLTVVPDEFRQKSKSTPHRHRRGGSLCFNLIFMLIVWIVIF